jgi:hypothetical protein
LEMIGGAGVYGYGFALSGAEWAGGKHANSLARKRDSVKYFVLQSHSEPLAQVCLGYRPRIAFQRIVNTSKNI